MANYVYRSFFLISLILGSLVSGLLVRDQSVTAQPPTFSVRQLPLLANDLLYHAAANTLFASVPSAAGAPRGNTVTAINPATGELVWSVFVGSDPGKLALSTDGQTLFVTLNGAAAIRRIELATRTAGAQYTVGTRGADGPLYPTGLTAVAGQPQALLVTRQINTNDGELVIYDQQTPRPQTVRSNNGGLRVVASNEANRFFASETGPFSSPGLYRLTLENNGLTVAQRATSPFSSTDDFRLMRGLLFAVSGRVANAETLAAAGSLGDWGAGGLITTDENVGRVFLLTGGGGIRTLRAFDPATLASLGALDIAGISGSFTSPLLRWGANGFAFSTNGGQVFIVQTLLVPSTAPIPVVPAPSPTPSVSPTPSPTPLSWRRIQLATNDLAYDTARGLIYASVPSTAGAYGNSLVTIDPVTGAVSPPIWIGSEPAKLALSDNGQMLYVALTGARAIRRFDLATRTPGASIPLAMTTFRVNDLKVLPGKPDSIAVVRYRNAAPGYEALEIYDNELLRARYTTNFGGPGSIAFGNTAERLYGNDLEVSNGFYQLSVQANSISGQVVPRGYAAGDIAFHEGLIYSAGGQVFDPETLTLRGRFTASGLPFLLDAPNRRCYFMTGVANSATRGLAAFDTETFLPVGNLALANAGANASSLVRWGVNGLAFRTPTEIHLLQTELVPGTAPTIPPQPAPTLAPLPTPAPVTLAVRSVNLTANDLVYDAVARTLYASVPANGGARANSLTPIVPETGALLDSLPLGAEPERLAIARDSKAIYVASKAPNARLRRFDTVTKAFDDWFAVSPSGSLSVLDMDVLPGFDAAVVAARSDNTVALYDNRVARPMISSSSTPIGLVEFGATADRLYGYNTVNGSGPFRLAIDPATGVSIPATDSFIGGFCCFNQRMIFDNGLLYSSGGVVVDPVARQQRGVFVYQTLGGTTTPEVLSDAATRRVFFFGLKSLGSEIVTNLYVFDQRTFFLMHSVTLADIPGSVTRAVRWGANGLALVANNRIYLVNTNLLEPASTNFPAAPVSVSSASYQPQVAAGSIVTAFGTQLATQTQAAASVPLPTTLAGTRMSLSLANQEIPLSLFFVSPGQINFLLPQFFTPGPATLTTTTASGQVFVSSLTVETIAPGLFSANANGQGVAAAFALRVRADGSQSYEAVAQFDTTQNRWLAVPIDLGPATDQVFLVLYGTGWTRRSNLNAVTVRLGGVNAPVLFAGAQGQFAGLDQINVALPRALSGRGDIAVELTVDGKAANPVRVSIK